ncbi:MAG: bifunctional riboflavin kinase/FAD synthetase, partial [Pseudomonadales bacterium]|nr:bifunctional riboflavin kinase/FAD synthetase [Pseudomonadales bacterium]
MEFIRGAYNLRSHHQGCVATIGNFDGVHLGHQAIIQQLLAKASDLSLPSVVILFEPQPREYFTEGEMFAGVTLGATPARLTTVREKVEVLTTLGVDRILCLKFNKTMCSLTATQFCQKVLISGLAVKHLVVGDDFHFGNDRCGDFAFLQKTGQDNGFAVESTCTYEVNGERVSSTRIRAALKAGEFELVESLLGRHYSISGRVVHGDQIGRTIGVPTANVLLQRTVSPLDGVFAVEVIIAGTADINTEVVSGVANVGTRPTVGGTQMRLEAHLLDFNNAIYGRRV